MAQVTTRTIAFLIFDDFQLLDAAGPIATFEMPIQGIRPPPYRLVVIAERGGLVRRLGIPASTLSTSARRLADRGLIKVGAGTLMAA